MIIKSCRPWAGWRSRRRRWATRKTGSSKTRKTRRSGRRCNMKPWRKSSSSSMIRSTKSNPRRRRYWFAWGSISSDVHDFCFSNHNLYFKHNVITNESQNAYIRQKQTPTLTPPSPAQLALSPHQAQTILTPLSTNSPMQKKIILLTCNHLR